MSTTLMPVTVDTFETRQRHIGAKVTTVTRKAAFSVKNDDSYEDGDPEGPIPVTVHTFEASGGTGGGYDWGGGRGAQTHIEGTWGV